MAVGAALALALWLCPLLAPGLAAAGSWAQSLALYRLCVVGLGIRSLQRVSRTPDADPSATRRAPPPPRG